MTFGHLSSTKRVWCWVVGHRYQWGPGNKPWRIVGRCERCDKTVKSIKRETAKQLGWLDSKGYPEIAKLMCRACHPEAPE